MCIHSIKILAASFFPYYFVHSTLSTTGPLGNNAY